VPVLRGERSRGSLYVGISEHGWLEFLRSYPISERATLTLNDRQGVIIARTLNPERSVGRRSGPEFLERIRARDEGASQIRGLEGQHFYTAFSRSRVSGWVLGTGVPREEVEASLRDSTLAMLTGVIATALLVALFAIWIGSRIIGAITGLSADARRLASPGAAPPGPSGPPLAIEEAETVRQALGQAHAQLVARDAERDAAYAREASARAEAERSNAAKDEFLAMLGQRAAQSPQRDEVGLGAARRAGRAAGGAAALARGDRAPGRAADRPRRRHARRRPASTPARSSSSAASSTSRRSCATCSARSRTPAGACTCASMRSSRRRGYSPTRRGSSRSSPTCSTTPASTHPPAAMSGSRPRPRATRRRSSSPTTAAASPPSCCRRIFDVFAQGERTLEAGPGRPRPRPHGGAPAGLAARRQASGWRAPARAGGAIFQVSLPLASAGPRDATQPLSPPTPARRIVVVEDNVDNRELMQLLLGLKGHAVNAFGDGEAGVAAILGEAPEVAIVDIGLPGIDGYEVARRIRGAAPAQPPLLVAVTGYGTPEDRQHALSTGFDAFMVKPFDIEAFERLLREKAAPA
jgi:CheY-like chemotaxis protein